MLIFIKITSKYANKSQVLPNIINKIQRRQSTACEIWLELLLDHCGAKHGEYQI